MAMTKIYTVNTFVTFGEETTETTIFETSNLEEAKDFFADKLEELEKNKVDIFYSEYSYEDNGISLMIYEEDLYNDFKDINTIEYAVVSYYDADEPLKFKIMTWKDGQSDRKEEFRDLFAENWEDAKEEFRKDIINHYEDKNCYLTEDDLDWMTETKFSYDTRNHELIQVK